MYSVLLAILFLLSPAMSQAGAHGIELVPSALQIYPNAALLVETGKAEWTGTGTPFSFSLPGSVAASNVEVTVSPQSCRIEAFSKTGEGKADEQELSRRLEELEKKRKELTNRLEGTMQQVELLKSLPLPEPIAGTDEVAKLMELMGRRIPALLDQSDAIGQKIQAVDREIKAIKEKMASSQESRFEIGLECTAREKFILEVRYPISLQKREFTYKIKGDTSEKRITITGALLLKQATGRDWGPIEIDYFTAPKNQAVSPPPFRPDYLTTSSREDKGEALFMMAAAPAPARTRAKQARRVEAFSRDVYRAEEISIPAGREIPVELFSYSMKDDFKVEIDGYATATPFLSATVKPPQYLPPASARLFLDSSAVGFVWFEPAPKGQERKIYFGEDTRIKVAKKVEKLFTKRPFLGSRITQIKEWRYDIENLHSTPMRVVLVERTPLSSDDDIEVKAWGQPKWTRQAKNGKTEWEFSLSPGAKRTILFGTEVKRPE